MTAREVIAYAITHAGYTPEGKAIKGGPYVADLGYMPTPDLAHAWRHPDLERVRAESKKRRGTRVIRIVRAERPSPCPVLAAADASAIRSALNDARAAQVEAIMELPGGDIAKLAWLAREVLGGTPGAMAQAALSRMFRAGPDPSEVVRAALAYWESGGSMSDGPLLEAVDAYRKAGGK